MAQQAAGERLPAERAFPDSCRQRMPFLRTEAGLAQTDWFPATRFGMVHRFPGELPVVLREKVQASDEEGAFLMQGEMAGSGVFPEVRGFFD